MPDFSRPWPLGLGTRSWWPAVLAALVLLAILLPLDHGLSDWITNWPAGLRRPIDLFSRLGEVDWILIPTAVLCVLGMLAGLFARRRIRRLLSWQFAGIAAYLFLAVAAPSLFTRIVKRLIGRGRPMHFADTGVLGLRPNWLDWSYQSFPSGHTTTAFALAVAVGLLAPRAFYPVLLLAVLIGLSRLTLGAHYPTDVVAGAIVGTLGAYAVRWLFVRRGWLFRQDASGAVRPRLVGVREPRRPDQAAR